MTKIGQYFWLAFWILLIILFSYVFTIKTTPSSEQINPAHLVIRSGASGHFFIEGKINNMPTLFLIDTGATDVVIPLELAQKLDLPMGPQVQVVTANGRANSYLTRITELKIGNITLKNVRAMINPNMHDQSVLLGMSALKRLEIRQKDGKLHLIKN